MSAYSTVIATCPQDQSVAIHAATVVEALAEAFETFRDKQQLDALQDVYNAMLSWEELSSGYSSEDGTDFSVLVTTEDHQWFIDFAEPLWTIDLRMSLFHGKLIFESYVSAGDPL